MYYTILFLLSAICYLIDVKQWTSKPFFRVGYGEKLLRFVVHHSSSSSSQPITLTHSLTHWPVCLFFVQCSKDQVLAGWPAVWKCACPPSKQICSTDSDSDTPSRLRVVCAQSIAKRNGVRGAKRRLRCKDIDNVASTRTRTTPQLNFLRRCFAGFWFSVVRWCACVVCRVSCVVCRVCRAVGGRSAGVRLSWQGPRSRFRWHVVRGFFTSVRPTTRKDTPVSAAVSE